MKVFSRKFDIFWQTFSDEKIVDNYSTVKNLVFTTAPHHHHLPSCYDATASESNQIEILSNRIGYVISRIAHL